MDGNKLFTIVLLETDTQNLMETNKGRSSKMAKKSKRGGKRMWRPADIATLKKLFSENPTAKIAKRLGRSLDTVKKKASRMGLRKSKRYLKSIGRAG
jgi:DNA invertase Pin-like site-specific DNA recombinase